MGLLSTVRLRADRSGIAVGVLGLAAPLPQRATVLDALVLPVCLPVAVV
jgi:hypothetical protein